MNDNDDIPGYTKPSTRDGLITVVWLIGFAVLIAMGIAAVTK